MQFLVVDDSPVIRKVARRIFEGLGFQTNEAEDGNRAISACREAMPGVILVDWNMPVMDGFAFMRELRRLPNGTEPTVLLCTTENEVAHVARAMHAGADGILMKPFDQAAVRSKIAEFDLPH